LNTTTRSIFFSQNFPQKKAPISDKDSEKMTDVFERAKELARVEHNRLMEEECPWGTELLNKINAITNNPERGEAIYWIDDFKDENSDDGLREGWDKAFKQIQLNFDGPMLVGNLAEQLYKHMEETGEVPRQVAIFAVGQKLSDIDWEGIEMLHRGFLCFRTEDKKKKFFFIPKTHIIVLSSSATRPLDRPEYEWCFS
jgi:hypothetical protein